MAMTTVVPAVPGEDEQGVVDAHAEADHGAEDERELRDVHEGGQDTNGGGAHEDAEQRRDDREAHRHHGSERHQQHDDGDADADELAARRLLGQEGEGPGELDLHPAGAGGVGDRHGVVELGRRELVQGVGDVEVGGLPIGADGGRSRGERVRHAGDVGAGGQSGTGLLDGRRVARVIEPPVVGMEHDAAGKAAAAGEPVVQGVGGVLGLDAGHPFAVVELAARTALQGHDGNGDDEPETQHPERVPGAGATEAVQVCAHGILLGWGPATGGDECTIQDGADVVPRYD
jgi:hypothetical protein